MYKIIFFFLTYCSSAHFVGGFVVDSKGYPIAYANIGMKNTSIGTLTNSEGEFNLKEQKLFETDTLVISHLGYETMQLSIVEFNLGSKQVVMTTKPIELSELTIKNKSNKGKRKVWGNSSKSKSIITGWGKYAQGEESGLIINNNNEVEINSVCFQVAHNTFKSAKFRLRIRKVKEDLPTEDILNENFYIDVTETGKYCIDISQFPLLTDDDFYVGLELVTIVKDQRKTSKRDIIALSGTLFGTLYYKKASASQWIDNGSPGPSIQIYVTKY